MGFSPFKEIEGMCYLHWFLEDLVISVISLKCFGWTMKKQKYPQMTIIQRHRNLPSTKRQTCLKCSQNLANLAFFILLA